MQTQQFINQYKSKVTRLPSGVLLYPINNNVVDVFRGDGWESHSRYRKIKGRWVHVSGTQLTTSELAGVLK